MTMDIKYFAVGIDGLPTTPCGYESLIVQRRTDGAFARLRIGSELNDLAWSLPSELETFASTFRVSLFAEHVPLSLPENRENQEFPVCVFYRSTEFERLGLNSPSVSKDFPSPDFLHRPGLNGAILPFVLATAYLETWGEAAYKKVAEIANPKLRIKNFSIFASRMDRHKLSPEIARRIVKLSHLGLCAAVTKPLRTKLYKQHLSVLPRNKQALIFDCFIKFEFPDAKLTDFVGHQHFAVNIAIDELRMKKLTKKLESAKSKHMEIKKQIKSRRREVLSSRVLPTVSQRET